MLHKKLLPILLAVCSGAVSFAFELPSIDVVPIRTIFASPQSYHLHMVNLKGRVKANDSLPRARPGEVAHGYVLTLEDDTGQIEAADRRG